MRAWWIPPRGNKKSLDWLGCQKLDHYTYQASFKDAATKNWMRVG